MPVEDKEKSKKAPKQSQEMVSLARRIDDRYQEMRRNRSHNGDDKWDTWDRMYRNLPPDNPPEDWQANVFVPYVQSTELAILAEITDRRPRWILLPQTPDDEDATDVLQAVTDFTLDKGDFDDEMFKFIHDKLHYGTSVWKEVYRQDRRVIKEIEKDKDGKAKEPRKFKEKDIRDFDDVYGRHVPVRDFYLDDKATTFDQARDCVERKVMNVKDFKEKYRKYRKTKRVEGYGFEKPVNEQVVENLMPGGDLERRERYKSTSELKKNEVEVIEYWNKMDDSHVIVANGIVIVNEPNPYDHKMLPYAMDVAIPLPNSPYGMGIPQLLEAPQDELNTMHNMMIDEAKLSIHKPILMGGMTVMDEAEYQLRPKGIIPVDDVTQVRELTTSDIASSNFRMFEEIKQSIRVASGLDVRFAESQTSSGGVETATEVLALQESSIRRINLYQKILTARGLERIGHLRTSNIQQFYKDPLRVKRVMKEGTEVDKDETTGEYELQEEFRVIRIQRENESTFSFLEITPERIRGKVDVQVVPQSTQPLSRALLLKRLNTLLQTVLSFPPALQLVDLEEILRTTFKQMELPTTMVKKFVKPKTDNLQLANEENIAMANGETFPPTEGASPKHTAIHGAFIYELDPEGRLTGGFTQQFQALDADRKKNVMAHYEGEKQAHALQGQIPAENTNRTVNTPTGTGEQEILGGISSTPAPQAGV